MSIHDPNKLDDVEQEPDEQELTDDDLKTVSGGMSSVGVDDPTKCISSF